MKKKPSVKVNYLYSMLYSILSMILPLITSPYISRVIGSTGLGIYSYNYTVVTYFMQFASLGIGFYGNRSIAKVRDNREKMNKVFSEIFTMQIITSFIMIMCYLLYTLLLVKDNIDIALLMLFYVITPAFSIGWFFNGLENFKITVTRNIVIKALTVFAIFVFVKTSEDLWIYVLIMSLGYFLSEGYLIIIAHRFVSYKVPKLKDVVPHFKPNVVLFIPIFAVSIYRSMDKLMLKWIVDYDEVGYYSNAEKIINVLLAAITALGQVMLPKMTYLLARGDNRKFVELNRKSIKIVSILSIAMAFGIMGVADRFVPLFFGNGYELCIPILKALGLNIILLSWGNTIKAEFLIPKEEDYLYIKSVGVGAVVNLCINILLIPSLHSIGAVIGTISAELISLIVIFVGIKSEFPVLKMIKENMPYVVIGFIMLIAVKTLNILKLKTIYVLLIQIVFGGSTYIILMLIFWHIINDPLKNEILKMLNKFKRK